MEKLNKMNKEVVTSKTVIVPALAVAETESINLEVKMKTLAEMIAEGFELNPDLSWKTFAANVDVTYQMLLKAMRKPVAGVMYDPEKINFEAVAEYIKKSRSTKDKEFVLPDMKAMVGRPAPQRMDIGDWTVGMKLRCKDQNRGYGNDEYTIICVGGGYISMMPSKSARMCVLNYNTFYLQRPYRIDKPVEVVETVEEEVK